MTKEMKVVETNKKGHHKYCTACTLEDKGIEVAEELHATDPTKSYQAGT